MEFEMRITNKKEAYDMVSGNLIVGNEQLSDDSKVCRFCFGEGLDESDWLRPCKCSGSMLWVHRQCFNTWLQKASGNGKVRCEICKFIYKKVWLLKSWEEWCFPKMFDELKGLLSGNLMQLALWAVDGPSSFFITLILFVTPFLLISAFLSWKLRNAIKKEKRREKLRKSSLLNKKKQ